MASKRFSGNAKALREVQRFAQQNEPRSFCYCNNNNKNCVQFRVNVHKGYFAKHANNKNNITVVEDGPLCRIMKRRMPELATTYRPSVYIKRKPKSNPSSKISLQEKKKQSCSECFANLCFVHKRRFDGSSSSLTISEPKKSSSVLSNMCVMPNELIAKILRLGETDRVLRTLAHTMCSKDRRKLAQQNRQFLQFARMSNADTKKSSSTNNEKNRLDVPQCKYEALDEPLFDGIITKDATKRVPKGRKRDSVVIAGIDDGQFVSRVERSPKSAQKACGEEKSRRKQISMTVKMHKDMMMQRCQDANTNRITQHVTMKSSKIFVNCNCIDGLESSGKLWSGHLRRNLKNECNISKDAADQRSDKKLNEKSHICSNTVYGKGQQQDSSALKVAARNYLTTVHKSPSQSMDNDNFRASKLINQPGLNWHNLLPVQQQRWHESIKFANHMTNSEDVSNTATATSAWPLVSSVQASNNVSCNSIHYNPSPGALKSLLTDNEYGKKALLNVAPRWADRPFLKALCGFGTAANSARKRDRKTIYAIRSKSFDSDLLPEQGRGEVVQTENHSTFADTIDSLFPSIKGSQQKCAELKEQKHSLKNGMPISKQFKTFPTDQECKVLVEPQQRKSEIEEEKCQQTDCQFILLSETKANIGMNNQIIELQRPQVENIWQDIMTKTAAGQELEAADTDSQRNSEPAHGIDNHSDNGQVQ